MAKNIPLVRRFVAGTVFEDVLPHQQKLADAGITTTINILGEDCRCEQQARAMCQIYLRAIAKIRTTDCYLSIKPTMIGLAHSSALASELLQTLIVAARARGVFIRLDMESSRYVDATLDLYAEAKRQYDQLGIVLQAYLHRTVADVERLQKIGAHIRLCKGAYKEPASVAFQDMHAIRKNYLKIAAILLKNFSNTAFATHDDELIKAIQACASPQQADFEFQMLFGMRRKTWYSIRARGYRMRVYIPYGDNWFPYFSRRVLERKENLFFVLRNLIKD
ncbi:MAG: proline dehydrogenase family protein [Pseudomonadota bacterium]|nr:proline dehydrogenase family protein [Pseudomonadota bacterium]